jgi:16S rRNA (guanine527-N7)-methyltransferase
MNDLDKLAAMLAQQQSPLSTQVLEELIWFRDELLRWNQRINLTAIRDPAETLEKHLYDSLTLLPFLRDAQAFLDLGSGGGFPVIPVKIVMRSLPVWSVDSCGKKIAFQRHIARALKFSGFTALSSRAEKLPGIPGLPRFDVVVARAFASIGTILRLSEPLLAKNGIVIAMKGSEAERELAEAAADIDSAQMACCRQHYLRLPISEADRTLLVFSRKTELNAAG